MELFRFYKALMMVCLVYQNLSLSWSLNQEGVSLLKFKERVVSDPFGALLNWTEEDGVIDPCLWFGVECLNGNVVILILRNNSFSGVIPEEVKELKKLKVIDLEYNKFGGALPSDLNNNLQFPIFLLDNNEFSVSMPPEIDEIKLLSKVRRNGKRMSCKRPSLSCCGKMASWRTAGGGHIIQRKLLTTMPNLFNWFSSSPSSDSLSPSSSPSPSPSISPSALSSPSPSPSPATSAVTSTGLTSPSVFLSPTSRTESVNSSAKRRSTSGNSLMSNRHRFLILVLALGCPALLILLAIVLYFCQSKLSAVKPWATGLSGQLQKAFVTGVPKLKRSELNVACEDFSNVIGSSSMGTMYKGTLSSGVEIAVTSLILTSAKNWPKNLESQFRKKIDQLSKVNHKNFVNLIGYCEEKEPFTRMMVFEYAPNGTLFEHLHIKEAEHLDWGMRLRIAMGMAYCLEHMHQLKPPISHKNLNSSVVNLTEDYAAKISDFGLWTESAAATEMQLNPESNVYSFGVILFEMITGKLPYLVDSLSLQDWASEYLRGQQPLRDMVDPILSSHNAEQLEKFDKVIKSCCCPNPKQRPTMQEVTGALKDITGIGTDRAVPKLSPLWWAELEIMSSEAI
ncbi:inactive receptor-like serine/threonine-protein kinase At2g40270 isoform X2 [Apium graveolens]|uniref:inactive receptor-like serine/threonine-protein kinase At2g40270 isoform X2 n=1 Tax=Apium graveolens TaxID=4045 RepID=UPI003D7A40D6